MKRLCAIPTVFALMACGAPQMSAQDPVAREASLANNDVWHAAKLRGVAFRAIGQNLQASRASGITPTKFLVANFTISCAFAGLFGGVLGFLCLPLGWREAVEVDHVGRVRQRLVEVGGPLGHTRGLDQFLELGQSFQINLGCHVRLPDQLCGLGFAQFRL